MNIVIVAKEKTGRKPADRGREPCRATPRWGRRGSSLGIAAGRSKVAIYRKGELHRQVDKADLDRVLEEEIERLR